MTLKEQKLIINEICKSETFVNAPTSIALLQFLTEATINDIDLNESLIAIDFFGKKEVGAKVRVNVYNLRKKLDKYYENEGKDDQIRVVIEKGQYKVTFKKYKNPISQKLPSKSFNKRVYWGIISVLIIGFLLTLIPKKKPEIWRPFLSNINATSLVIGDVFGMLGNTATGNYGWTRDYSINSVKDYYALIEQYPKLKDSFVPSPYSYVNQMAVEGTLQLASFFSTYKKGIQVRYTSRTSIDELKENNTIYIGPIKTKTVFVDFFNEANPYFTLKDSLLLREHHPRLKDTVYRFPYRVLNDELAIVSKIKGPNNSDQILFFSNHDMGIGACIKYFTTEKKIKKFTKLLDDKIYFTAIFNVKGMYRSDTYLELLEVVSF